MPSIKCAVGISAPCDLASSARELDKLKNIIYSKNFLGTLIDKMKEKEGIFPAGISRDYKSVKTLRDFDDMFTAPLNGFKDAMDYWTNVNVENFTGKKGVKIQETGGTDICPGKLNINSPGAENT